MLESFTPPIKRRGALFAAEVPFFHLKDLILWKRSEWILQSRTEAADRLESERRLPGESPELLNGRAQTESGTTSNRRGAMEAKQVDAWEQSGGDTGLPNQYGAPTRGGSS